MYQNARPLIAPLRLIMAFAAAVAELYRLPL